jgi:hypothetical protein
LGLGEVIQQETKECINCNKKCTRCEGTPDFCTACSSQYALFPNNTCDTCIEPIEKMFYDEKNKACKYCAGNC